MSQQIQLTGGAKVRDLQDVIIGTSGVLSSLAFDVANGVPKLDSNGKILVSQLPNSVMEYKGTWNAATNTPTLVNGTGNQGDVYLCNVAGTVDFGAGPIAFVVGDQVIYSGSIWQRASGATGTVTSVAITESGDSLNITGSPITTSGTINIGFNGTNLQYVNGAGNLTTFPDLTGYVPYTGATGSVNLGAYLLTASGVDSVGYTARGSGTLSGYLILKQGTTYLGNVVGYNSINANARKYVFISDVDGTNYKSAIFELSSLTNNTDRTYTLPDASGTLALTSDIPILTGYVPYTGATANVDLGVYDLTADLITGATGSFASSGGSDTFAINHSSGSGIALNITKGGNGEGLYINKTSGSGNAATIIGTLNATTLVKNGGTSSQFLKADGTVDSSTYALDSLVVHLAGTETITGAKTFSTVSTFDIGLVLKTGFYPTPALGYVGLGSNGSGITILTKPVSTVYNNNLQFSAASNTYNFPNATGTLALTSDLTGGTVTSVAALTLGTTGTDLSSTVANSTTTPVITLNVPTASATNRGALSSADWTTFNNKQSALTNPVTGTGTTNYLPKFTGTSTIGNSNITDSGSLITLGSNTTISSGALGIGTTSLTGYSLRVSKSLTGSTGSFAIRNEGVVLSDVTSDAIGFRNDSNTQAAAFTLTNYWHFWARQGSIGAGSAITNQYGYVVDSNMVGATNNYAFQGNIPSGTNRWNLYMAGTAANYMAGSLGIGSTSVGSSSLLVSKTIGGGASRYGIWQAGQVQSDVTTLAIGIYNQFSTAASAFTLPSYVHLLLQQSTIGAGSTVTNQYGVFIDATMTGATNNYGIYSSLASGTNRWNLYFAGTAANYMAGVLNIGTTTLSGYTLDVNGTGRFGGTSTYNGFLIGSHTNNVGAAITNKGNANATIYADNSSAILNAETNLFLRTGNTDRLTIASTGAATFSSSVRTTDRYLWGTATNGTTGQIVTDNTDNYFDYLGTLYIRAAASSATRLTIASTGAATFSSSVGIGVAPDFPLTIKTDASANSIKIIGRSGGDSLLAFYASNGTTPYLDFSAGATYVNYNAVNSQNYNWYCNSSLKMVLTSGGNVLIGTTTDAGGKLQVNGEIRMYGSTLFRGMSSNTLQLCGGTSSSNVKIDGSVEVVTIDTNGATRLTIASSGAATFSSQVNAESFYTNDTRYISNQIMSGYNANSEDSDIWINYTGYQGGTTRFRDFRVGNGKTGQIAFFDGSAGTVTFYGSVTATSFFESSSIKGKNIIATNPLLALDIDVIKYTRKNDESKDIRYGYSAEQIHSLMPELTDKDVTAVKYLDVHTILISQLQKEIKELKAKLN